MTDKIRKANFVQVINLTVVKLKLNRSIKNAITK